LGKFFGEDHLTDEELFEKHAHKFFGDHTEPLPLVNKSAGVSNKKFQTYNIISGQNVVHEVNMQRRKSQPENIFQPDHLHTKLARVQNSQHALTTNDNKYGHFYANPNPSGHGGNNNPHHSLASSQHQIYAGKKLIRDAGKFTLG